MAAVFARHEPGYPLPRRTALCRRFQATDAEIDAAVGELVRRQLLRRLPTGEVHRAGPAEYLISLQALPGLSSVIDPIDHIVSCTAARISRQRAPADVAEVLGMAEGTQLNVRRCAWSADGEPAAASATYVPDEHISLITATPSSGQDAPDGSPALVGELALPGLPGEPDAPVHAGAVRIDAVIEAPLAVTVPHRRKRCPASLPGEEVAQYPVSAGNCVTLCDLGTRAAEFSTSTGTAPGVPVAMNTAWWQDFQHPQEDAPGHN